MELIVYRHNSYNLITTIDLLVLIPLLLYSAPPSKPTSMPDGNKKGAYGNSAGPEASFRRTWDREAYAAKASEREAREREEGKARYEAKLSGKKYYAPPPTSHHPSSSSSNRQDGRGRPDQGPSSGDNYVDARASRLDVSSQIGKVHMLTGSMASVTGRRGRGAGFYCEDCDLTFKDNLQWVDHLNSKQHLIALAAKRGERPGEVGEVKRASLEEVRARLRFLKEKRERETKEAGLSGGVLLEERLRIREAEWEQEREERRVKRREARRRNKGEGGDGGARKDGGVVEGGEEGRGKEEKETRDQDKQRPSAQNGSVVEMDVDMDSEMAKMMGFQGFGTTKA